MAITGGSAVLLALAWKDARKLFGADRVRHAAIAFGFATGALGNTSAWIVG
jgi:hypothetical protein